jgi:hypothetical protein
MVPAGWNGNRLCDDTCSSIASNCAANSDCSFVVAYRLRKSVIEMLGIIHGSRR